MVATNRIQQEKDISGLVLTYRVNDTLLCVPVEHVESIIEPPAITALPHAPDYVIGAFMHRGQTALALSLHKLLGLPPAAASQRKESLLMVWMGDQPVGYWVDEVKGMTDSNRGHWSAVPALIRDQGITRALICDGQVYFPIDLSHSRQFNEITRALKVFEQSKLQSVPDEAIERPQLQAAQPSLDTPPEPLLTGAAEAESSEQTTDNQAESLAVETTEADEPTGATTDANYSVADFHVETLLAAGNDEDIEANFLAEQGIDTTALAQAMHAAMSANTALNPQPQPVELEYDANGQADAFYALIAEAEQDFGPVEIIAEDSLQTTSMDDVTSGQVDAFGDDYQALLAQDMLTADIAGPDASERDYITARESRDEFDPVDELKLTEEPYSYLPTSLPDEEPGNDHVTADTLAPAQLAEIHQTEIDAAFDDAGLSDELNLTEEPYSLLPTSLPEDDESDEQALLDEEIIGVVVDDLIDVETISDEAPVNTEILPAQQQQTQALLPHLTEHAADKIDTDDSEKFSPITDSNVCELPVIELPHTTDTTAALPEFAKVISKADFYTDKMASLLSDTGPETNGEDTAYAELDTKNNSLPLVNTPQEQPAAKLYELKIPQISPQDEPPEPAPSLGKKHITPQLEQGAVIIRPDGQINKNFGLVKLFTIILATSAASSWWYRDELFYREQLRKEIPSILRNEIAFLYSDRVTIVSPEKGAERMIVDTPEQEIKVIRKRHVSRELLREGRKKDVKIHRVRRGDTLWAIASLYLDDPYRYPELAENNRIHNSDLIRTGDVVKITTKTPATDG